MVKDEIGVCMIRSSTYVDVQYAQSSNPTYIPLESIKCLSMFGDKTSSLPKALPNMGRRSSTAMRRKFLGGVDRTDTAKSSRVKTTIVVKTKI